VVPTAALRKATTGGLRLSDAHPAIASVLGDSAAAAPALGQRRGTFADDHALGFHGHDRRRGQVPNNAIRASGRWRQPEIPYASYGSVQPGAVGHHRWCNGTVSAGRMTTSRFVTSLSADNRAAPAAEAVTAITRCGDRYNRGNGGNRR